MANTILTTTSNPHEIEKRIALNGGCVISIERCDHNKSAYKFKFKCATGEQLDAIKSAVARFRYFGF